VGWSGEGEGSRFGRTGATGDKQSGMVPGAKVEVDSTTETGQPPLDSIAVSPMIVVSPPAHFLKTKPQKSSRKGPGKVNLTTHIVVTYANKTCSSND
jgi:hypothetical protein